MTPFEYLQKCRIWNSMDAVLEKTASMGDIAVENGFAGASYFQRLSEKRWAVLLQIIGNGTVACQMNVR